MVYNVAIVEDDDLNASTLKAYIEKYSDENDENINVVRYSDGDEITSDYKPHFQIIFLDIQMKRMNGMETAEYIRRYDKEVALIFITNMSQFAVKGYAVGALDFLVKPVSYFAFSEQLRKSLRRADKKQASFLLIPTVNGLTKMSVGQITFIESFRHQMHVHTKEGDFIVSCSMSELEGNLLGKDFFRCGKSFLVNLAYVNTIKGSTVVVDKTNELSVGRSYKKPFMDALTNFVARGGGITI